MTSPTIYQLPTPLAGTVGILPVQKYMVVGDNLATVTTAGYLNSVNLESYPLANTDIINALYSYNPVTTVGTYEQFSVSISNGVITLVALSNAGEVTLPTIANHIATYTNTAGHLSEDAATAINGGNIQAGLSGTAGTLASFPATASKGALVIAGVANTGNTLTTISNAAMGQASVVSIPDPGAATAKFLLDSGTNTMAAGSSIILAKVNAAESGNAVTASGNSGVITTSSLTAAGGTSYAITWTNTFISTSSVILLTLMGGTNTTKNITIQATAGAGTSTITIYNNTAATSLNGTVLIGYTVL
jgi:hypothetical protein